MILEMPCDEPMWCATPNCSIPRTCMHMFDSLKSSPTCQQTINSRSQRNPMQSHLSATFGQLIQSCAAHASDADDNRIISAVRHLCSYRSAEHPSSVFNGNVNDKPNKVKHEHVQICGTASNNLLGLSLAHRNFNNSNLKQRIA